VPFLRRQGDVPRLHPETGDVGLQDGDVGGVVGGVLTETVAAGVDQPTPVPWTRPEQSEVGHEGEVGAADRVLGRLWDRKQ